MAKNPPCQCRRNKRHGFDPWLEISLGGVHGNTLQYSCLENPMDRGAWLSTVHRVSNNLAHTDTQPGLSLNLPVIGVNKLSLSPTCTGIQTEGKDQSSSVSSFKFLRQPSVRA